MKQAEAQRRYREAVLKFGPDSLPALKAALQLARVDAEDG